MLRAPSLPERTPGPLGQPEKAMGHESRMRTMVAKFDRRSALLVSRNWTRLPVKKDEKNRW